MCEAPSIACEPSRSRHLRSVSCAGKCSNSRRLTRELPAGERAITAATRSTSAASLAPPTTDKRSIPRSVSPLTSRCRICVRQHMEDA